MSKTYQDLVELAQQHESEGNLEGLQKAHTLLLECDTSAMSETERDRIWGRIFNLREDMLALEGRAPLELSDEDLAELGLKVVDPSKFDPESQRLDEILESEETDHTQADLELILRAIRN